MELTELQWDLLEELVSRAAADERARARRMANRPRGSHSPVAIRDARSLSLAYRRLQTIIANERAAKV